MSNHQLDHTIPAPQGEDPVRHLHEYDLDLRSNHIYLFGIEHYNIGGGGSYDCEPGIEYIIANRFIRNMNLCMRINPNLPIVIHMKTNGGYWEEGMAIYDTIKACPFPITILNYTHARSMSSIIYQAANKRIMMPHSTFLFHDGTFGIDGTVKQVQSAVEFGKIQDKQMITIYNNVMSRSGVFKDKTDKQRIKWLREQMDKREDVYLTAEEAVEYGFADAIFDYNWASLTEYSQDELERG